jgi:hypothetical protein
MSVSSFVDALPASSFPPLSHATTELSPEQIHKLEATRHASGIPGATGRDRAAFARLSDSLDLLPPGIELVSGWSPDGVPAGRRARRGRHLLGRHGRKA